MSDGSVNSVLTRSHRDFLRESEEERDYKYTRQGRSYHKREIRERTRMAFRDLSLLCQELEEEERAKIFGDPRTSDREDLKEEIADAIQLMYMGLGGVAGFSDSLRRGVQAGESVIGGIDSPLEVHVRFSVDSHRFTDYDNIIEIIEAEEWERLGSPDLFDFLGAAVRADAIDFDAIRDSSQPSK